jgi:putative nucleotidyltransferase with HDIG domain
MIKKVKTSDLKVGMFIHDLNVPWLDHRFAMNRFLIKSEKLIEKIASENITHVLIDTLRGVDATHAPSQEEAEITLMGKMIDAVMEPGEQPVAAKLESQWVESKKIQTEAIKVVSNILKDVRIGKQVNLEQAAPLVVNIAGAVLGNDGTLVSLCRIKQRDAYTFQHSVSISALLVTFCTAVGGYSYEQLVEIGLGGLFHDVGKMKVPDAILNKPGRLTEAEFRIMRTHVDEGVSYLRSNRGLSEPIIRIAAEHHEKFDGSGYPKRIARSAISVLGQMASIVDVYDAITSLRIYHTALEPPDALKRIFEWSGKHFDETLVQTFIKAIGIYPVGSLVRLKSGRLGVVLRQGETNLLMPYVRVIYHAAQGHRLPPQDINLASPDCQDQIVGYEIPVNWGIDPMKFIGKGH